MKLIIYHLGQDDPKKCTARKMERFGLARLVKKPNAIPRRSIILDPYADVLLSKADKDLSRRYGITAVDCSWEDAEEVFSTLSRFPNHRSLPFLIPVNPVNFGKPRKLSTLEAFIACMYILEEEEMMERLLRLYKWSHHFVEINKEYLEMYRSSRKERKKS